MRVDLAGQINWFNKLATNKYGESIQIEEDTNRGIMVLFSASSSSGSIDHVAVASTFFYSRSVAAAAAAAAAASGTLAKD